MTGLTHLDGKGAAHMVDVSEKATTVRRATTIGFISLNPAALEAVRSSGGPKGDVVATARIAGIMAAKRTATLIPLCHPLPIASVTVEIEADNQGVTVTSTVSTSAQTGVEMEAMTATTVALLTIYDMVKALDKACVIGGVRLLRKEGGKSGLWQAK
jgi:cyclic pyranopterin phosphate synthase